MPAKFVIEKIRKGLKDIRIFTIFTVPVAHSFDNNFLYSCISKYKISRI